MSARSRVLPLLLCMLALAGCGPGEPATSDKAQAVAPDSPGASFDLSQKYMANIQDHTEAEFMGILRRAEQVITAAQSYPDFEPIEFVLHGAEAGFFVRENYTRYREIVDLAARLDAFGVVDIKICEAWMSLRNLPREQLPAFVETVPYGPAREEQLEREGYRYF